MPSNKATLSFNGLQFVRRPGRGHTDPVPAQAPATAAGYFRRSKRGTHLYRTDGSLAAYLVHNPKQGYFSVTAHIDGGRPRYMYSTCQETEQWLQIAGLAYGRDAELIRATLQ